MIAEEVVRAWARCRAQSSVLRSSPKEIIWRTCP